jgi:hypothetical protein
MALVLNNLRNDISVHNQEKSNVVTGKKILEVELDRNLEIKSMTAEDWSGKLIQRAELISEREEIEQKNKQIELVYTSELEILDSHISVMEKMNDLERDQLLRKRRIKKYQKIIEDYSQKLFLLESDIRGQSAIVDVKSKKINQDSVSLRIDLQSLEEKMEEEFRKKGWYSIWLIIKENYETFGRKIECNNLITQRTLAYTQIETLKKTFDEFYKDLIVDIIEKENLMVDGESDDH